MSFVNCLVTQFIIPYVLYSVSVSCKFLFLNKLYSLLRVRSVINYNNFLLETGFCTVTDMATSLLLNEVLLLSQ